MESIGKITNKVIDYYKNYGPKKTCKRVYEKVVLRDKYPYRLWRYRTRLTEADLNAQASKKFENMPLMSIVVPLYKTPEPYLEELVHSVCGQTYANWELILSDGSGEDSPITDCLKKLGAEDSRIRVIYNHEALRISENTNAALSVALGDYIVFADHDDLLPPDALFECVKAINEIPEVDLIYSDEDKIDMAGKEHFMPHFKPDFDIDLLRSENYFCHLVVVRRRILNKVGFLNPEFDGAQDYDFVLRCVEASSHIHHIPKILYTWRAHKDSTAENPESKNYAFEAGCRAVQAHYDRCGIKATVEQTEYKGLYRSRYEITGQPLISVLIPNKDHIDDLEKCLDSLDKATYGNLEYLIIENNSTEDQTFRYYESLPEKHPRGKVLFWEGTGFNFSALNNYGAQEARGKYLLLLNNDTALKNEDCIEELLGPCQREDVGAVGARLYYEDGLVQHAGIILGMGGIAGHAHWKVPGNSIGYFGRVLAQQDLSAVTAACLLVKRSVFEEVGGLDESLAVAFNDVDFCLKIREKGYLIYYNPYAELMHYESKSRGYETTPEKVQRFHNEIRRFSEKWDRILMEGDPYYNVNLALDKNDFSVDYDLKGRRVYPQLKQALEEELKR